MKQALAHTMQIILSGLFLGLLVIGLPFAWIMRDGMGPDSMESSGMNAVVRCLQTFYVGPALVILGLLAIAATVVRKAQKDAESPNKARLGNPH
jgi:hypothetical protein